MGHHVRKRAIVLWLSNLSRRPRRVRVIERIPVSEIEDLDVVFGGGPEWRVDEKDGFVVRDVDLGANASVKTKLSYEIRAPSKMVLPASL